MKYGRPTCGWLKHLGNRLKRIHSWLDFSLECQHLSQRIVTSYTMTHARAHTRTVYSSSLMYFNIFAASRSHFTFIAHSQWNDTSFIGSAICSRIVLHPESIYTVIKQWQTCYRGSPVQVGVHFSKYEIACREEETEAK